MQVPRPRHAKPDNFAPQHLFIAPHKWAGAARCTSWARSAGRQCLRAPIKGRPTCKAHGGGQGVGAANSNYKIGSFSQFIVNDGSREKYEAYLESTELAELRDNLALIKMMIAEELQGVYAFDPGRALETWTAFNNAWDADNVRALAMASKAHDKAVRAAYDHRERLDRMGKLIDDHRRMSDSKMRQDVMNNTMITQDRWSTQLDHIFTVMGRQLKGHPQQYNRIVHDLEPFLTTGKLPTARA